MSLTLQHGRQVEFEGADSCLAADSHKCYFVMIAQPHHYRRKVNKEHQGP